MSWEFSCSEACLNAIFCFFTILQSEGVLWTLTDWHFSNVGVCALSFMMWGHPSVYHEHHLMWEFLFSIYSYERKRKSFIQIFLLHSNRCSSLHHSFFNKRGIISSWGLFTFYVLRVYGLNAKSSRVGGWVIGQVFESQWILWRTAGETSNWVASFKNNSFGFAISRGFSLEVNYG